MVLLRRAALTVEFRLLRVDSNGRVEIGHAPGIIAQSGFGVAPLHEGKRVPRVDLQRLVEIADRSHAVAAQDFGEPEFPISHVVSRIDLDRPTVFLGGPLPVLTASLDGRAEEEMRLREIRVIGFEGNDFFRIARRTIPIFGVAARHAAVDIGRGFFRIQIDGLAVIDDGAGVVALQRFDPSAYEEAGGILGREQRSFFHILLRTVDVAT